MRYLFAFALLCIAGSVTAQSQEDQQSFYAICMKPFGAIEPDVHETPMETYVNASIQNAICNCGWEKARSSLAGYARAVEAFAQDARTTPQNESFSATSVEAVKSCAARSRREGVSFISEYRGNYSLEPYYRGKLF